MESKEIKIKESKILNLIKCKIKILKILCTI